MNKTKEKPLILHPHEIRAALRGRLGQVRRPLKEQPGQGEVIRPRRLGDAGFVLERWPKHERAMMNFGRCEDVKLPHHVGDVLWCRETYHINHRNTWVAPKVLQPNDDQAAYFKAGWERTDPRMWKSSVTMPRWAARIILEVTAVKVERLHEITPSECYQGGAEPNNWEAAEGHWGAGVAAHRRVWDANYAPKGLGWDTNPWTAVYGVKVLTTTGEGR